MWTPKGVTFRQVFWQVQQAQSHLGFGLKFWLNVDPKGWIFGPTISTLWGTSLASGPKFGRGHWVKTPWDLLVHAPR